MLHSVQARLIPRLLKKVVLHHSISVESGRLQLLLHPVHLSIPQLTVSLVVEEVAVLHLVDLVLDLALDLVLAHQVAQAQKCP